jgi:hypothetical protein
VNCLAALVGVHLQSSFGASAVFASFHKSFLESARFLVQPFRCRSVGV